MTLNTHFRILDPVVRPEGTFLGLNLLVGGDADTPHDLEDVNGYVTMSNPPGLGLRAWIFGHWMADGSLLPRDECDPEDHEETEDGKCYLCRSPDAYVELSFDTTYGYRGENGESCSDLHRWIIESLGTVCGHFNVRWAWQNEFSGEWFEGTDGLEQFGREGSNTRDWFENVVKPAILAEAGATARFEAPSTDFGVEGITSVQKT